MNRREFLKLGATLSALLVLPLGPLMKGINSLATVELNGVTYRGSPDGKFYASTDGQAWDLLTDFGPGFNVFHLALLPYDRIYARLGFAGEHFGLVFSPDKRAWRTV